MYRKPGDILLYTHVSPCKPIYLHMHPYIQQLFADGELNIGEYLPSRRRSKSSPIFTEPERNRCFDIISELNNREMDV